MPAVTADIVSVELEAETQAYLAKIASADSEFSKRMQHMSAAALKAGKASAVAFNPAANAFTRVGQGLKGVDADGRMAQQQMRNLAFQFQDIGTMLASGQSPFMLLSQQLPQVTMYGGSLNGVMGALRGTVAGLFSPLGIATTAFVLLGSAAVSWASSAKDGAEDASKALERHRERLAEIIDGYVRAEQAADNYRKRAALTSPEESQEDLGRQRRGFVEEQTKAIDQLRDSMRHLNEMALTYAQGTEFEDTALKQAAALTEIQKAADATEPDLDAIIRSLKNFLDQDVYHVFEPIAQGMLESAEAARRLTNEIGTMDAAKPHITSLEATFTSLQAAIDDVHSDSAQSELEKLYDKARQGELSVDDMRQALGDLSATTPDLQPAIAEVGRLFDAAIATRQALEAMYAPIGGEGIAGGKGNRPTGVDPLGDVEFASRTGFEEYFNFPKEPKEKKGRSGKSEAEREREAVVKLIEQLEFERSIIGLSAVEKEKANALRRAGSAATDEERAKIAALTETIYNENAAIKEQEEAFKQLQQIGEDAINGIANAFADGKLEADEMIQIVGSLIQQLLTMKNIGGGLGGFLSSIFGGGGGGGDPWAGLRVPSYADGTNNHPGGLARINERGGEIVNLPSGSQVIPHDVSKRMGASSFTFAPQIDMRGASVEAVARIEQVMAKQQAQFESKVVATVRGARKRRML